MISSKLCGSASRRYTLDGLGSQPKPRLIASARPHVLQVIHTAIGGNLPPEPTEIWAESLFPLTFLPRITVFQGRAGVGAFDEG